MVCREGWPVTWCVGRVACHMVCREGRPVTWCVGRGGLSHGV